MVDEGYFCKFRISNPDEGGIVMDKLHLGHLLDTILSPMKSEVLEVLSSSPEKRKELHQKIVEKCGPAQKVNLEVFLKMNLE